MMDDGFKAMLNQSLDEQEMLQMIEERVALMLDTEPELLMSYMYRMDVLEVHIKQAMSLHPDHTLASAFAQLIWNRQKERLAMRKRFKQDPIEGWEY